MLFVGRTDRGFFAEEYATKHNMNFDYIEENAHIKDQVNSILALGSQDYIIFDIEQYIDNAQQIADTIKRICVTNNAKAIIYAPGYASGTDMLVQLRYANIQLYITASQIAETIDQLEKCLNGYVEANGIEQFDISSPAQMGSGTRYDAAVKKSIAITGICDRIGTTTYAIQFAKYLALHGYTACYIQMNDTKYVECMSEMLADVQSQNGILRYQGVDHLYDLDQIDKVLCADYDYYIYDYGTYTSATFNRLSFLEKNYKFIVMGIEPQELTHAAGMLQNMFYSDVTYIFNFSSTTDREDIEYMMSAEKMKDVFIPGCFIPDKYTLYQEDLYQDVLPLDIASENTDTSKKRKWGEYIGKKLQNVRRATN